MLWAILYPIYILIGFILLFTVALKPKLFWPLLLIVSTISGGLMVQGQGLVDEYLIGMIVIGAFLTLLIGATRLKTKPCNALCAIHKILFAVFILYMLFESIRGILALNDLRVTRWVLYYITLGLLAFIITKKGFPVPHPKKIATLVTVSTSIYLSAYLLVGVLYEYFSKSSKWDLQGYVWAGSAAAVFPLVIALPCALFLMKSSLKKDQTIAWTVIILGTLAAHYYSARTGVAMMIIFLLLSLTMIKFHKVLMYFAIFLTATMLLSGSPITKYIEKISKSVVLQDKTDSGRLDHFRAALSAISESEKTLLFGYGVHTSRYIIAPYLAELGYFGNNPTPPIARVTGIAASTVDAGLIGLILFYAIVLLTAQKILFIKNNKNRIPLFVAIGMISLWPIISDLQDLLLLYLLIIPSGIMTQLSIPLPSKES